MRKILIVEDEHLIASAYSKILGFDYFVKVAPEPKIALSILEHEDFDLIISDFNMPGMTGVEFYNCLRKRIPFVIVTGNIDGVENFPGPVYSKLGTSIMDIVRENLNASLDKQAS